MLSKVEKQQFTTKKYTNENWEEFLKEKPKKNANDSSDNDDSENEQINSKKRKFKDYNKEQTAILKLL